MEAVSLHRAQEGPYGVGAGLWNLGNICYMNAALHYLTHTPPLAHYLLSRRNSETCPKPMSCVLCAMQAHVTRAFLLPGDPIEPSEELFAGFHRLQQEDAHEYLMFTMDAMEQACLRALGQLARPSSNATLIRQIFGGYWRSHTKCLCCHSVSDTLDPYLDIALDIQGAQNVAQALELLVTPEKLDGDNSYACGVCLKKVPACKTLTLHAASKVLILALKHFSAFTGSKTEKVVHYPERLDVRQSLSEQNTGPLVYELYAVLVHSGRDLWGDCHNGHYFCYVKAAGGQWFKMNDAKVTACATSTALSQRAYVLFYVQEGELERGHGSVSLLWNLPQDPVTLQKEHCVRWSCSSAEGSDTPLADKAPSQLQVKCKDCGAFGHKASNIRCPLKQWDGALAPQPLGSQKMKENRQLCNLRDPGTPGPATRPAGEEEQRSSQEDQQRQALLQRFPRRPLVRLQPPSENQTESCDYGRS
ncbi:ubiquitin carboxyl-terminal hydrolase 17-like protein 6 [Sturnira hondurensis]|uniref:ubiquitin carboxyl-terminal hydrolase 17-like protein 6 n=1 Tax=Sturnira hondurensis TaxID=192404 RepID=UPI001879EE96|nr:ubiquitin carboxyl-terminal hydrolase 17-like protein 6 [Sturnira hondurensis]